MRSLSEQITALCEIRGVQKRHIAATLGITPVYLSQMLKRGMDRKWLERVAALLGVEPYEIDAYIQARAPDLMRADDKVLHFLRSRLSGRDEPLHRPADKTPRQHRRVPDEALWVSPSQAARILNVARSTLYEMMDEGQIRWSRLKGRRGRRIEMAEIRRVMESA